MRRTGYDARVDRLDAVRLLKALVAAGAKPLNAAARWSPLPRGVLENAPHSGFRAGCGVVA